MGVRGLRAGWRLLWSGRGLGDRDLGADGLRGSSGSKLGELDLDRASAGSGGSGLLIGGGAGRFSG